MSVPDYKKAKAMIMKWDSDSKVVEKNRYKQVSVGVVQLEKTAKTLRNDVALWKMSYQHMYVLIGAWSIVADKLILKQAELKDAVKAKDTKKSGTLNKEIEKLDKEATKIKNGFDKAHDETAIIDKKFGIILRATDLFPK